MSNSLSNCSHFIILIQFWDPLYRFEEDNPLHKKSQILAPWLKQQQKKTNRYITLTLNCSEVWDRISTIYSSFLKLVQFPKQSSIVFIHVHHTRVSTYLKLSQRIMCTWGAATQSCCLLSDRYMYYCKIAMLCPLEMYFKAQLDFIGQIEWFSELLPFLFLHTSKNATKLYLANISYADHGCQTWAKNGWYWLQKWQILDYTYQISVHYGSEKVFECLFCSSHAVQHQENI